MDDIENRSGSAEAPSGPPEMSWSEALETVHSLADGNVLEQAQCDGDDVLAREAARQREAVDTLGDFVTNHADRIDGLELPEASAEWPDSAWRAEPGMEPADLVSAIKIAIELAGQNALDGEDGDLAAESDRQQQALEMARGFLGMHSATIRAEITTVRLGF